MAPPGRQVAAGEEVLDDVPMCNEVDQHEPGRPVGDTGRRKHGVDGARELGQGGVDRASVPEVDLDGGPYLEFDRSVVHDDHLGPEVSRGPGGGSTHSSRSADDQHPLAVVPEGLDTTHSSSPDELAPRASSCPGAPTNTWRRG